jgi:hypothetical protein
MNFLDFLDFKFFVGLHQPSDARRFERCCISINRLRGRKKPLPCKEVLVDSGAFSELLLHGRYRHDVDAYAAELHRLHSQGIVRIAAAVAQDYMCEEFILEKTGLDIPTHQRLTIERYDALVDELDWLFGGKCPFRVMPVLQGYAPQDYARHVVQYGSRLKPRMWVGVGSVCKRNSLPDSIVEVLRAIHALRPDLHLHGFGVKTIALSDIRVKALLATADSMAWSFAARNEGRNANCWTEAKRFAEKIVLQV